MCHSVVVDASSVTLFQKARVLGDDGPAVAGMEHILSDGQIVMDAANLMLQEWMDSSSFSSHDKESLMSWVSDQHQRGKIILHEYVNDAHGIRRMRQFGMKGRDPKYILTAQQSGSFAVISDDVDFFDPTARRRGARSVNRAKQNRCGPVVAYARRNLGIEISTIDQAPNVIPRCEQ